MAVIRAFRSMQRQRRLSTNEKVDLLTALYHYHVHVQQMLTDAEAADDTFSEVYWVRARDGAEALTAKLRTDIWRKDED